MSYVYGEWNWYALGKQGMFRAIAALLWPAPGALGRREIAASTREAVLSQADTAEHVYSLTISAAAARRLLTRLDLRFESRQSEVHHNEVYGYDFVPDPRRYCALSNCNCVMAGWLRELGCQASGWALVSKWRVATP